MYRTCNTQLILGMDSIKGKGKRKKSEGDGKRQEKGGKKVIFSNHHFKCLELGGLAGSGVEGIQGVNVRKQRKGGKSEKKGRKEDIVERGLSLQFLREKPPTVLDAEA